MNIQSDYSYNISMQGKGPHYNRSDKTAWKKFKGKVKQKLIDIIPEKTFKAENSETEKYGKTNSWLSRPDVNRLIMGTTALATQPWIDRCNHSVDEETRKVSMYRTIAKIVAGTTVGILIRGACYKLVGKMTNLGGTKKYSRWLIPRAWIEKFAKNSDFHNNYKSTLSTLMALSIMMFTNFLLDAPLTVFLTNKFTASDKSLKRKEAVNG